MKTDTNMLGSHGNAGSDAGGLGRCIPITFPGNLHAGGDHTWGHGGLDHGEEDPEMVRGATRPPVPQAGRLEEAPSSLDSGRRRPGAGQKRSSDHRERGSAMSASSGAAGFRRDSWLLPLENSAPPAHGV